MLLKILTQPLWADLLGILLLALLLLHLLRVMVTGGTWRPVPAALPLALWALFPLLQAVPLPPVVVHWLSPRAWEIYWQSVWVVQPQAWMPLSLAPLATMEAFFRGAAAWGLYLLVVQILAGRQRLERLVLVLSGVAVLSALLDLLFPALPTFFLLASVLLPVILSFYMATGPSVVHEPWRSRLTGWLSRPQFNLSLLLSASLLLAVLLTVMPGVQGGWSAGLLIFSLLLLTRRRLRRWGGGLALLAVLLLLVTMLPPYGRSPFPSATALQGGLQIITDFPVFGVGSGAQADVFHTRALRGDELRNSLFVLGVGVGLGGLLLAGWALICWLRSTLEHWRKRRNTFAVCLYAGCLGGLLTAILHAAAPLLLLPLLAALAAVASLHSSRSFSTSASPMGKFQAVSAMLLVMLLLAGQITLSWVLLPERLPGAFGQYHLAWLSVDRQQALIEERLQQGDLRGALQHTATILRLRPLNVAMQLQAADILDQLSEEESADQLWLSAAAVTDDGPRRFAQRLWQRGSSEAAKNYLRRTLAQSPQRAGEFVLLLEFWGVEHNEMEALLPDAPLAQLALGEFLNARAENTLAAARFRRAVLLARDAGGGQPEIFERAGEFFLGQGLHHEALEMVQTGLQHFPASMPLRRMAGDLYERLGIHYRAIEEYRHCLVIDPADQWSRQRLKALSGEAPSP